MLPSVDDHTSGYFIEVLTAGFVGLPFGLLLVLVCGAELFTGNVCLLSTAVRHLLHAFSLHVVYLIAYKLLLANSVCGAELFTGNVCLLSTTVRHPSTCFFSSCSLSDSL